MKKIFSFDSPREHYKADACIVWCFDGRFSGLLNAFSAQFKNFDLIKVAGGAKALSGGALPCRDFVLEQIETSIRLHHAKQIILMRHLDCGADGGSESFPSLEKEMEYMTNELADAKKFVADKIPDVPIKTCFADFNGLYDVEVEE